MATQALLPSRGLQAGLEAVPDCSKATSLHISRGVISMTPAYHQCGDMANLIHALPPRCSGSPRTHRTRVSYPDQLVSHYRSGYGRPSCFASKQTQIVNDKFPKRLVPFLEICILDKSVAKSFIHRKRCKIYFLGLGRFFPVSASISRSHEDVRQCAFQSKWYCVSIGSADQHVKKEGASGQSVGRADRELLPELLPEFILCPGYDGRLVGG